MSYKGYGATRRRVRIVVAQTMVFLLDDEIMCLIQELNTECLLA